MKKNKQKKMSHMKKLKLQRYVDWLMKNGVKDKGRAKRPVMTNSYGRIIR